MNLNDINKLIDPPMHVITKDARPGNDHYSGIEGDVIGYCDQPMVIVRTGPELQDRAYIPLSCFGIEEAPQLDQYDVGQEFGGHDMTENS